MDVPQAVVAWFIASHLLVGLWIGYRSSVAVVEDHDGEPASQKVNEEAVLG